MTVALEPNPLREGLEQERVPDASCLVIFGASGDLTQRKLIPGLYSLAHDGLLPAGQTIIGFSQANNGDVWRINQTKNVQDTCKQLFPDAEIIVTDGGGKGEFVGMANYAQVVQQDFFWRGMRNTFSIFLISGVTQTLGALAAPV